MGRGVKTSTHAHVYMVCLTLGIRNLRFVVIWRLCH